MISRSTASVRNPDLYRGRIVEFKIKRYTPEEAREATKRFLRGYIAEVQAANAAREANRKAEREAKLPNDRERRRQKSLAKIAEKKAMREKIRTDRLASGTFKSVRDILSQASMPMSLEWISVAAGISRKSAGYHVRILRDNDVVHPVRLGKTWGWAFGPCRREKFNKVGAKMVQMAAKSGAAKRAKVKEAARKMGWCSSTEVAKALNIDRKSAFEHLKAMAQSGEVEIRGVSSKTRYRVLNLD